MKETKSVGINEKAYFSDTYALFKIIEGNPKYKGYSNCRIIITIFNLAEFNYNLKKEMSKERADKYTRDYYYCIVKVGIDDIIKAMDLKTKHKNLSIPDAIGYVIAKKYHVKILTGDEDFRDLENVEFVKK